MLVSGNGASRCGNDSVVVTWVYGLNQAMGNYTYAVSTATYDLDSGIVETCTQLDFPPLATEL